MKKQLVVVIATVTGWVFAGSAVADFQGIEYSVSPNVIFGSGNPNGNFTIDRSNGVELGLRAKIPYEGTTNFDGHGNYYYTTAEIDAGERDTWNFDWSINTNYDPATHNTGWNLDDLDYLLEFDYDPGIGTAYEGYGTSFGLGGDPTNVYFIFGIIPVVPDHSIGNNFTGNGQGLETTSRSTYNSRLANNNVLQNSWTGGGMRNTPAGSFDPYAPGIYNVRLSAFDGLDLMASTEIAVYINTPPPAVVPLPGAAGLGLVGLGLVGYLRRRKSVQV